MSQSSPSLDAVPPREIARRVEELGVAKSALDTPTLLLLAVLAGAFISIGSILYAVVVTGSSFGFGPTRLIGGVSFSVGLVLVVIAGAELFTGNNLIAIAWASRRISSQALLRNWIVCYAGNMVGCLITMAFCYWGGIHRLGDGQVGRTLTTIAETKGQLSLGEAFARGTLCNALVCLAVWLTIGGRTVADKIPAVVFPVTAFVTLGLEHSIANGFFLPYGLLLDSGLSVREALTNLAAVTVGNIVGGSLLVAGVYWVAYLRRATPNVPAVIPPTTPTSDTDSR